MTDMLTHSTWRRVQKYEHWERWNGIPTTGEHWSWAKMIPSPFSSRVFKRRKAHASENYTTETQQPMESFLIARDWWIWEATSWLFGIGHKNWMNRKWRVILSVWEKPKLFEIGLKLNERLNHVHNVETTSYKRWLYSMEKSRMNEWINKWKN